MTFVLPICSLLGIYLNIVIGLNKLLTTNKNHWNIFCTICVRFLLLFFCEYWRHKEWNETILNILCRHAINNNNNIHGQYLINKTILHKFDTLEIVTEISQSSRGSLNATEYSNGAIFMQACYVQANEARVVHRPNVYAVLTVQ